MKPDYKFLMAKQSGIYLWYCIPEKKVYIGRAVDLNRRFSQFINFSQRYSTKAENLQGIDAARKKYPQDKFWKYVVLKECPKDELNKYEQLYILLYHSNDPRYGYNLTKGGTTGTNGYHHNKETKALIAEKLTEAAKRTPEHIRKERAIYASSFVDRNNPVYRKNLSEALMGHIEIPETKAKIRASQEKNMKSVLKLDVNLNLVDKYPSIKDASRSIMRENSYKEELRCYAAVKNVLNPNNAAKTARGFKFTYA